ncbi:hypothetical protein [Ferrithrix thermotolerans]|nr:hypothetical protein [Ferrithrix thermotolerans]
MTERPKVNDSPIDPHLLRLNTELESSQRYQEHVRQRRERAELYDTLAFDHVLADMRHRRQPVKIFDQMGRPTIGFVFSLGKDFITLLTEGGTYRLVTKESIASLCLSTHLEILWPKGNGALSFEKSHLSALAYIDSTVALHQNMRIEYLRNIQAVTGAFEGCISDAVILSRDSETYLFPIRHIGAVSWSFINP